MADKNMLLAHRLRYWSDAVYDIAAAEARKDKPINAVQSMCILDKMREQWNTDGKHRKISGTHGSNTAFARSLYSNGARARSKVFKYVYSTYSLHKGVRLERLNISGLIKAIQNSTLSKLKFRGLVTRYFSRQLPACVSRATIAQLRSLANAISKEVEVTMLALREKAAADKAAAAEYKQPMLPKQKTVNSKAPDLLKATRDANYTAHLDSIANWITCREALARLCSDADTARKIAIIVNAVKCKPDVALGIAKAYHIPEAAAQLIAADPAILSIRVDKIDETIAAKIRGCVTAK